MQGGALRLLLLYALLARVIPNPARFLTVLLVIGCGSEVRRKFAGGEFTQAGFERFPLWPSRNSPPPI